MEVFIQRLKTVVPRAQHCLCEASEVVVFGSMSVGIDRPDSDIDVLCIGGGDRKLKTKKLDLIIVPAETPDSPLWLQSELLNIT